ncbi:family 14 glycosylhydrolase [Candidatus Obscuribacterales bacterium]|nr:family 14 glycosylhydrolase [Candidatus Obscuribacterales bacterium]
MTDAMLNQGYFAPPEHNAFGAKSTVTSDILVASAWSAPGKEKPAPIAAKEDTKTPSSSQPEASSSVSQTAKSDSAKPVELKPASGGSHLHSVDALRGNSGADTPLAFSVQLASSHVREDGRLNYDSIVRDGVKNFSAIDSTPTGPAPTLLEAGLDKVSKHIIDDKETRHQFNHYSGEFLKTASLFATPKIGMASAALLYGLDNVHTDADLLTGTADFALGGAKGAAMRQLFTVAQRNMSFAPAKGVAMGMASRGVEVTFSREMITNPGAGVERLKRETLNPALMAYDAATFVAAEGMFGAANKMTAGALKRSPLAASMTMGGSFGLVNGGSSEIIRQQSAGENFDLGKVLKHAGLEGGVGALGAGFGAKASDPMFYKSMGQRMNNLDATAKNALMASGLKENTGLKTYEITGDKLPVVRFQNGETSEATTTVREVKKYFFFEKKGPEKTLELFHNEVPTRNDNGVKLIPGKSLIANCFPERLSPELRSMHALPESTGAIWLDVASKSNRMRLVADNTIKADPASYKPLGTMTKLARPEITMNVMAPLAVGNMENPNDPNTKAAWEAFDRDLANAKKVGVDGVSTDIWWGLVEPKPGEYNWKYYDQLSEHIKSHGLKWVPILSLHQAGGNVGDDVYVPLPFWVWGHLASKAGSSNPDYAKYQSEQGNKSSEYVSAWATDLALPRYKALMESFQNHFADRRNDIAEINVSLGPAGEIRYPSYNSHDQNSGYPTRGALQSYSEAAVKSFQDFAVKKYGSADKVKEAWGAEFGDNIAPPKNPGEFFGQDKHHHTQYGKDFFDWYNESLTKHGKQVLNTALDVFGAKDAPFSGIDIGAKMPGVHWRVGERQGDNIVMGDRLAELAAGLITTSRNDWWSDDLGRGYRPMLQMFKDVQRPDSKSRVVPHFTALEMADGHEGPGVKSMPYALATWVGQEAVRQGLTLKGENALSWNLHDHASWDRMRSFIDLPGNQNGYYHGLTLLRMGDVLNSDVGRSRLAEMIQAIKNARPPEALPEAK